MRKLLLATAASLSTVLAAGTAQAQSLKPVAPGTIVVHLNGYFRFALDNMNSTYNTYSSGGVSSKLSSLTDSGDFRLLPSFDAMTVDGIEYGVHAEVRTSFTDNGEGTNKSAASVNTTGTSSLYVRRAWGYIGEAQYGYVRYGQTDGAFTLLQNGVIEQFGDGAQFASTDSGDFYTVPSKAQPGEFIYADQGALYTTDKVVLISPAVTESYLGGKFSAMASYEPNANGLKEGYANCNYANGSSTDVNTCAALSSTNTFNSTLAKQRQNTFDVAGQYALKDWGFNTKVSVGLLHGNPIRYTGALVGGTAGAYTNNFADRLDDLEVYQFGAQTTYANLFTADDAITVGANVKWGQTLDGYAPKPVGTRDALSYIVGGDYTVGPYVIGGSFFDGQTAGNYNPFAVSAKTGKVTANTSEARTLSEYGTAVGGNYIVGRDLSLYVQYMYGHSHQPGNSNLRNGNTQMQLVSVGSVFKW